MLSTIIYLIFLSIGFVQDAFIADESGTNCQIRRKFQAATIISYYEFPIIYIMLPNHKRKKIIF
jgi:hypothetical protein